MIDKKPNNIQIEGKSKGKRVIGIKKGIVVSVTIFFMVFLFLMPFSTKGELVAIVQDNAPPFVNASSDPIETINLTLHNNSAGAGNTLNWCNVTITNVLGFDPTNDLAALTVDTASGVSLYKESGATPGFQAGEDTIVNHAKPDWNGTNPTWYVNFTSIVGEVLPDTISQSNYYITIRTSSTPTNGAIFNVSIEIDNINSTYGNAPTSQAWSSDITIDNAPPLTSVAITTGPSYGNIGDGIINVTDTTEFTLTGNDGSGVGVDVEWWYINDLGNYSETNPFTLAGLSLSDGTYTLYYGSFDLLGNNETANSLSAIVDNTPPNTNVAITAGPSYGNIGDGIINVTDTTEFTLTGNDGSGVGVDVEWWYINDLGNYSEINPFTLASLSLNDGTYTLYYGSVDLLGNNETANSISVIVDNSSPTTILAITAGPSYGNLGDGIINVTDTTEFTLTGNDGTGIGVDVEWRYINDLGNYSETNPFTLAGLSLSDSTYTLYYGSFDLLGNNETAKQVTIILDNSSPTTILAITAGPSYGNLGDGIINVTDATEFTFTGNDGTGVGVDVEWWYINNLGNYSETNPFTLAGLSLSDGTYTLYYGSFDLLGNNETAKQVTIILDNSSPTTILAITTGPSYGNLGDGIINVTDATEFTLTGNDGTGVGVDVEWWYINDIGNYSETNPLTLAGLSLSDGTYTLYYGSLDLLGNNETAKQLTIILDNSPPTTGIAITSGPSHGNVGDGIINVTDATEFTLTGNDGSGVGVDVEWWYINDLGNYSETNPLTLAGLSLSDGAYTLYYGSIDLLGNNESANSLTVILDNSPPTTSIAITAGPFYGNINNGIINVTDTTEFTLTGNDGSGVGVDAEWWYINDVGNYSEMNPFTLAGLSLSDGTYTLYYGSIDLLGNNESVNSLTIILDNSPPTTSIAITAGPYYGNINDGAINVTETTEFTLTGNDGTGVGVKVEWWYINEISNYSETNPFTFDFLSLDDGTYTLFYGSIDLLGNNESVKTLTIIMDNTPPAAEASFDISGDEDDLITFDGSLSWDNVGIKNYTWDLGDGIYRYGSNPDYTFTNAGIYVVYLTVTDLVDHNDTDTMTVYINNVIPIANASSSVSVCPEGSSIMFYGFNSTDTPSDLPNLVYNWNFDDGYETYGLNVTHNYADNGNYFITLTVTDDNGGTDSFTLMVTINNVNPVVDAGGLYSGYEGTSITFTGSATDPGTDTFTYEWDFDDSNGITYGDATGPNPTWTWSDDFSGNVYLQVTDDDGGMGTSTATVTINNVVPTANTGGPYSGHEGSAISFTGSASDEGSDSFEYRWDFDNDGTNETSWSSNLTSSWTWYDDFTQTVKLWVRDDDGGINFDTITATVYNVAPTANVGGPYSGNEGSSISFNGGQTDPGTSDTFTYYWDFGDGTSSTQQNPTHVYSDDDVHTITLTVTDDEGGSDSDTTTATISNVNPTAYAGGPYSGTEGSPITFSGSATDQGDDTFTYEWDFDDSNGITYGDATGSNPTWTWFDDFSGTIYLRVTDDDGGIGTSTTTVTISNVAPLANAGGPYSGYEGSAISFTGSAFDEGSDTFEYRWDFDNDGTNETSWSSNPTSSWTWYDDFTQTVKLWVRDDDGGISYDTITATVYNVAPTANVGGPYSGNEGSSISFNGGQTDPGTSDTFTYYWDFGDGTSSSQQNPTHVYKDDGAYTVTLTVTDDNGGSDSDTTTATISNVNPTAYAGGPYSGYEGASITFTGSATDPGTDTFTYKWDFDDSNGITYGDATGPNPTWTWFDDFSGTIYLRVTDDDGGVGTSSTTITISNVAPLADTGGPYSGYEGSAISFTGSASDEGSDSFEYRWDFDNDGTNETSWSSNPSSSWTWYDDFTQTVKLWVRDDDGGVNFDTVIATVYNVAPTADVGGPYSGDEGTIITFSGGQTDPGTSDTFTYYWDFDDGTSSSQQNPTHVYSDNNIYTVTLIVTDDDGGTDSDTTTTTISNVNPTAYSGGPYSGTEGSPITFSGSATDQGDDTFTYEWDFDDSNGITYGDAAGPNPTWTWSDDFSGIVYLQVTDDDGGWGTSTATVTISNVNLTANAGGPYSGYEGSAISFTGSASDEGSDSFEYRWDFDNDGTNETSWSSDPISTYTWYDDFTQTVKLWVRDDDGGISFDTVTAIVYNVAPTADVGGPYSGNEGSFISINGGQTDPGTSDTFTYYWDFGDGTSSTQQNPTHIYSDNGAYPVTLTVTDDDGGTDSDTTTATINNVDPTVDAGGPYSGNEGTLIIFSGSATDLGDDTFTYEWDFDDSNGITYSDATGSSPTWIWYDDFSGTIYLQVTDDDGGVGTSSATVTISNVVPIVDAGGPYSGYEGSTISFKGTQIDPGNDTFTYYWTFDDGDTSTEQNPTHIYNDDGAYTVTFTVTDDNNGLDTDTITVVINNVAPTAEIGGPYLGDEGSQIAFFGSQTDPSTIDSFTYYWDFGDGGSSTQQNPNHVYIDNGIYTVTLTVTDDEGGEDTDTASVTVSNISPTANAGGPYFGNESSVISFIGSATDIGSSDTFTYYWNFGDGSSSTQQNPTHVYIDDDVYIVTLTVTDDDGGTDSNMTTTTVSNKNPNANAGGPYSGNEGTSIMFSGSATDQGVDTFTYEWDFDDSDGITYGDATGPNPTWTWSDDFSGTIYIRVTDDDGGMGTSTASVTINNVIPTANAGGPYSGYEGSAILFTGSASDEGSDSFEYRWDFDNDGTNETSWSSNPTSSYAWNDDFTQAVKLWVTDDDGGISSDTISVIVYNVAPTAEIGGPYSGDEGSALSFFGDQTDPGAADSFTYYWDFGDGTSSSQQNPLHVFKDNGVYKITIIVTDDDGGTDSNTTTATVNNVNPIADAKGPYSGYEATSLLFSGSATDKGSDTFIYEWDFDDSDGITYSDATGSSPTWTWYDDFSGTIYLRVTDDDGGIGTSTATVTISNVIPTANVQGPYSGYEGSEISFTGSASDAGSDSFEYRWDFDNDGTNETSWSSNPTSSWTWYDDYTQSIKLWIQDDDGGLNFDTTTVTIYNVAPTADVNGPYSGDEGSAISFTGGQTDPGSDDTFTYHWDFGDGSTSKQQNPKHTYEDDGEYTVTLIVTDDDGDISIVSTEVKVKVVHDPLEDVLYVFGILGLLVNISGGALLLVLILFIVISIATTIYFKRFKGGRD